MTQCASTPVSLSKCTCAHPQTQFPCAYTQALRQRDAQLTLQSYLDARVKIALRRTTNAPLVRA